MNEGYVKLYRRITEWEWYKNPNTRSLFIHLLLTVCYKDTEYRGITLKRGQGAYTIKGLAEDLGMSEQNVRTAIANIKSTNSLTITRYPKYQVFTVQNFDWYQGQLTITLTPNQHSLQEKERDKERDKERKKEKKQKKIKKEKEKEREKEIRITEEGEETRTREEEQFKALFNSACPRLSSVRFLTRARKDAIRKLLSAYSFEDITQAFAKAGKSSFLRGSNPKKWKATFDWLIKEENFVKVIEGQFDDDDNSSFDTDEFFEEALKHSLKKIGEMTHE